MAVPFDAVHLSVTGEPVGLVDRVAQSLRADSHLDITGAGQFAVSTSGTLAYLSGDPSQMPVARLVSVDRGGRVAPLPFDARNYSPVVHLSPDGRYLAVAAETLTEAGLLIADLQRRTLSMRVSLGEPDWPRWSPDGQWLAFLSMHHGGFRLVRQRVHGDAPPETVMDGQWYPSAWSPDGRCLLAIKNGQVWTVAMGPPAQPPRRATATSDMEQSPAISPDGRWLSYAAAPTVDEGRMGRYEVYIRSFPSLASPVVVQNGAGTNPLWNPNGGELFFLQTAPGHEGLVRMMAARVVDGQPEPARPLFEFNATDLSARCFPNPCYAVAPNGEHFYMTQPVASAPRPPDNRVQVVLNFTEELKSSVRPGR